MAKNGRGTQAAAEAVSEGKDSPKEPFLTVFHFRVWFDLANFKPWEGGRLHFLANCVTKWEGGKEGEQLALTASSVHVREEREQPDRKEKGL